MRKKFMLVSKLAEQTARQAASSVERWKSYLDTACRVYKYGFEDQLLILRKTGSCGLCRTGAVEPENGAVGKERRQGDCPDLYR